MKGKLLKCLKDFKSFIIDFYRRSRNSIIIILIIIAIILVFEKGIYNLFFKSILGDIWFSFNTQTLFADIIFCVFSIILIVRSIIKLRRGYKFSDSYILIILTILIYYFSFRCFPNASPSFRVIISL